MGATRHLHDSGRIVRALRRPVPVILYDMFDPDAMFELTLRPIQRSSVADFPAGAP
ncbi:hypothetical protein AB0F36_36425 [Streptomyces sp. NPDC029080]|uniref:hypothetical protein n=1 Tax=Streptomyces sp. NPDC029080 TaxID=3155017 RepID=UPI0033CE1D84